MNKYLPVTIITLISLLLVMGIVIAANTFPTTLNDWEEGDIIEADWANALEDKIGADDSTVSSSLDYLIKSTSSDLGSIANITQGAGVLIYSDGNVWKGMATGSEGYFLVATNSSPYYYWSSLVIGANSIGDTEINYATVTLADFTDDISNATTGSTVAKATNLAANPSDCAANQFANAIDAQADLSCAALVDADIPNTITITYNATTGTALSTFSGAVTDVQVPDTITITDNATTGVTALNSMTSASALTTIGTIGTGVWEGTAIAAGYYAAGSIDGDDINSNFAGAYLTETAGSPDTIGVDAELYTRTVSLNFLNNTTSEIYRRGKFRTANAITITEIGGFTDCSTSVIAVYEALEATPNASSSSIIDSLTLDSDSASTTSFVDSAIAARSWVVVMIMDYNAATNTFPYVTYTVND